MNYNKKIETYQNHNKYFNQSVKVLKSHLKSKKVHKYQINPYHSGNIVPYNHDDYLLYGKCLIEQIRNKLSMKTFENGQNFCIQLIELLEILKKCNSKNRGQYILQILQMCRKANKSNLIQYSQIQKVTNISTYYEQIFVYLSSICCKILAKNQNRTILLKEYTVQSKKSIKDWLMIDRLDKILIYFKKFNQTKYVHLMSKYPKIAQQILKNKKMIQKVFQTDQSINFFQNLQQLSIKIQNNKRKRKSIDKNSQQSYNIESSLYSSEQKVENQFDKGTLEEFIMKFEHSQLNKDKNRSQKNYRRRFALGFSNRNSRRKSFIFSPSDELKRNSITTGRKSRLSNKNVILVKQTTKINSHWEKKRKILKKSSKFCEQIQDNQIVKIKSQSVTKQIKICQKIEQQDKKNQNQKFKQFWMLTNHKSRLVKINLIEKKNLNLNQDKFFFKLILLDSNQYYQQIFCNFSSKFLVQCQEKTNFYQENIIKYINKNLVLVRPKLFLKAQFIQQKQQPSNVIEFQNPLQSLVTQYIMITKSSNSFFFQKCKFYWNKPSFLKLYPKITPSIPNLKYLTKCVIQIYNTTMSQVYENHQINNREFNELNNSQYLQFNRFQKLKKQIDFDKYNQGISVFKITNEQIDLHTIENLKIQQKNYPYNQINFSQEHQNSFYPIIRNSNLEVQKKKSANLSLYSQIDGYKNKFMSNDNQRLITKLKRKKKTKQSQSKQLIPKLKSNNKCKTRMLNNTRNNRQKFLLSQKIFYETVRTNKGFIVCQKKIQRSFKNLCQIYYEQKIYNGIFDRSCKRVHLSSKKIKNNNFQSFYQEFYNHQMENQSQNLGSNLSIHGKKNKSNPSIILINLINYNLKLKSFIITTLKKIQSSNQNHSILIESYICRTSQYYLFVIESQLLYDIIGQKISEQKLQNGLNTNLITNLDQLSEQYTKHITKKSLYKKDFNLHQNYHKIFKLVKNVQCAKCKYKSNLKQNNFNFLKQLSQLKKKKLQKIMSYTIYYNKLNLQIRDLNKCQKHKIETIVLQGMEILCKNYYLMTNYTYVYELMIIKHAQFHSYQPWYNQQILKDMYIEHIYFKDDFTLQNKIHTYLSLEHIIMQNEANCCNFDLKCIPLQIYDAVKNYKNLINQNNNFCNVSMNNKSYNYAFLIHTARKISQPYSDIQFKTNQHRHSDYIVNSIDFGKAYNNPTLWLNKSNEQVQFNENHAIDLRLSRFCEIKVQQNTIQILNLVGKVLIILSKIKIQQLFPYCIQFIPSQYKKFLKRILRDQQLVTLCHL